jgi:alpha-amylase
MADTDTPVVHFLFGIHNHQPVGNFDAVLEEAYEKAYRPFLEALWRHPAIRVSLHHCGILLEWLKEHHPEYLDRLRGLVERTQVEILGGGFYEPILPVIPEVDRRGQIELLSDFIQAEVGVRPRGLWLTERVWEPHLVKSLADAGIEYITVDDSHFRSAGLPEHELFGYYLTEELGTTLRIFPISEKLRYLVPFRPVEQSLDFFRAVASDASPRAAILADDGEKFGVWPGTYAHVYEEGWLEQFFTLLEENSAWIRMPTFAEFCSSTPPLGRIYLPTASYTEMMEWVLPPEGQDAYEELLQMVKNEGTYDRLRPFLKGGFWRNFLVKYPEANNMHKKMLRLSDRIQALQAKTPTDRRVENQFRKARLELWQGQCNDAYWHGIFGGLYLPHLRASVYGHLLRAETLARQVSGETGSGVQVEVSDFDRDGQDEVLLESDSLNVYFAPQRGGAIFELDDLATSLNLLDTMARRPEAYHRKLTSASAGPRLGSQSIHEVTLSKEEGLENALAYDWYRRLSLLDHFLGEETTLDSFSACRYPEQGDFVNQPYEVFVESTPAGPVVRMDRRGTVWLDGAPLPVSVAKTVRLTPGERALFFDYVLTNHSAQMAHLWFGIEFNFSLQAGEAPDRYYVTSRGKPDDPRLRSTGALPGESVVRLVDEYRGLEVSLAVSEAAEIWRFPIETVSQSEAGFERVYQSSVLLPHWRIPLSAGKSWKLRVQLRLREPSG